MPPVPQEQRDPHSRKVGAGKARKRVKRTARSQIHKPQPPRTSAPGAELPPKIFGKPKPPPTPYSRRMLNHAALKEKGVFYHMNHLRRLWQAGVFPEPVKISPHRLAWREADVDRWLEQKEREWLAAKKRERAGVR